MNTELLLKVKQKILDEPKQFIMAEWFAKEWNINEQLSNLEPQRVVPNCKTAACIAGWTLCISEQLTPDIISRRKGEIFSPFLKARQELDISLEQADRLFYTNGWPHILNFKYSNAYTPEERANVAAERIDHFIKTNGEE